MNPKIFADLRNIMAKLYPDEVSIRRITADAELDIQRITFNSNAVNNWHSVLAEAEKVYHIEALLAVVDGEYGKNQEFKSIYTAYHQLTDRNEGRKTSGINTHPQAHAMPQRQRLPTVVVGLLLIGVVGGGLYWGIPGLRNLGIVLSTTATTIPDTNGTEPPLTGASSMASATPSPSSNTAIVTRMQASTMSFTSTSELPISTQTVTFTPTPPASATPTPTVTFTTTPQPTATATPVPAPTYPCEAEVVSPRGVVPVSIAFRQRPNEGNRGTRSYQPGNKVIIKQSNESSDWYLIAELSGLERGWASAEYFTGCSTSSE